MQLKAAHKTLATFITDIHGYKLSVEKFKDLSKIKIKIKPLPFCRRAKINIKIKSSKIFCRRAKLLQLSRDAAGSPSSPDDASPSDQTSKEVS